MKTKAATSAASIKLNNPLFNPSSKSSIQLDQQLGLRQTRQEEKNVESLCRQELLEKIQDKVVTAKYTNALFANDNKTLDFVGSSDEKASFLSDVIFYKLINFISKERLMTFNCCFMA